MEDAPGYVTVFHKVEVGFSNIFRSTQPLDCRCLGKTVEGLLWHPFHCLRLDNPRRDEINSDGRHVDGQSSGQTLETAGCMETPPGRGFGGNEPSGESVAAIRTNV